MNSDGDRNQILLKTPVIVSYYLFLAMELRNVLFIDFVCYFTEFMFVNLNSCSKIIAYLRLLLIQNEIIFVIIPLLTAKIGKPPNLASITVHFGLYNNFLPVIFTLLFCFQRASRSCFSNFVSQIYVMIHEI